MLDPLCVEVAANTASTAGRYFLRLVQRWAREGAADGPRGTSICLIAAYDGADFRGLQSVESELALALLESGLIDHRQHADLWRISWCHAVRTDKGAHAVWQPISCILDLHERLRGTTLQPLDSLPRGISPQLFWADGQQDAMEDLLDGLTQSINKHLPSSVRVLGIDRVGRSFDCRYASAKTYEYLLPLPTGDTPTSADDASAAAAVPSSLDSSAVTSSTSQASTGVSSVMDVDRLASALDLFVGVHDFRNFTTGGGGGAGQGAQLREVTSASVVKVSIGRRVFLRLTISGTAFLRYQVRKMVSLAVAVGAGCLPLEAITLALRPSVATHLDIPCAPACGLILAHVDYSGSRRSSTASSCPPLDFEKRSLTSAHFLDFKRRLYASIAERSSPELSRWLASLISAPSSPSLPPPLSPSGRLPPKDGALRLMLQRRFVLESGSDSPRSARDDLLLARDSSAQQGGGEEDDAVPSPATRSPPRAARRRTVESMASDSPPDRRPSSRLSIDVIRLPDDATSSRQVDATGLHAIQAPEVFSLDSSVQPHSPSTYGSMKTEEFNIATPSNTPPPSPLLGKQADRPPPEETFRGWPAVLVHAESVVRYLRQEDGR